MRLLTRLATLSLLVVAAAPLRAQNTAPSQTNIDTTRAIPRLASAPADTATARVASAPVTDLRAGAHYNRSTRPAAAMTFSPHSQSQPVALMIVGGAALLAGAIIGGDAGTIFMVGGAVVGLVGLYQYLQ